MQSTLPAGILVAFEGIDGAGKTTQVRLLEGVLEEQNIAFVTTKEPTNGPWGRRIRASARNGRMSPEKELHAFIRDRRSHVKRLLEPALQQGKVVVVDRYYLSTVAYQGARGLDPNRLLELNAFAPRPDLLFILDVEPAVGLARVRQRGDSADLFEREDELARARDIFLGLNLPGMRILDGTRSQSELAGEIGELVMDSWRKVSGSDQARATRVV